jgi:hypothetical protein
MAEKSLDDHSKICGDVDPMSHSGGHPSFSVILMWQHRRKFYY